MSQSSVNCLQVEIQTVVKVYPRGVLLCPVLTGTHNLWASYRDTCFGLVLVVF